MKKVILGVLVVGTGVVFLATRGGVPSKGNRTVAEASVKDKADPLAKSTTPIPLPKHLSDFQKPETIAEAQKKIRESTDLLRKQIVPLMKQLPDEVKKMEALIKQNDELIQALARTGEFGKPNEAQLPSQN